MSLIAEKLNKYQNIINLSKYVFKPADAAGF